MPVGVINPFSRVVRIIGTIDYGLAYDFAKRAIGVIILGALIAKLFPEKFALSSVRGTVGFGHFSTFNRVIVA